VKCKRLLIPTFARVYTPVVVESSEADALEGAIGVYATTVWASDLMAKQVALVDIARREGISCRKLSMSVWTKKLKRS